MILPMMGFLLGLICLGPVGFLVASFFPRLQNLSLYALFVPLSAGLAGLGLSWGLAIASEILFGSSEGGGVGLFSGYLLGILLGARGGFLFAKRMIARQKPDHQSPRWWKRLSEWKATPSIKCPYCGGVVAVSSIAHWGGHHSSGRIHIVAPGSIVPCPNCGKNLADFLRSGNATVSVASMSADDPGDNKV